MALSIKKRVVRLFRHILFSLPVKIRRPLLRQTLRLDFSLADDMVFKIADSQDELEQAFRLLHHSYVKEGFMEKNLSELRVTAFHALPTTTILVAKKGSTVIGTVSLIREGVFGLPLQSIFNLTNLKAYGHQTVEVSSLALHESYRGHQGILFMLCKFALEYCIKYIATDFMVIAVNPRDVELYEAVMLFRPLERRIVESYDFVNGAPAVGEYIDLRHYHSRLLKVYGNKPTPKNLFAFYMQAKNPPHFKFPERSFFKASDPVMTPELLNYFLNIKTNTLEKLSETKIEALRSVYVESPGHLAVFPESNLVSIEKRKTSRFRVQCQGTIITPENNKLNQLRVLEISRGGFLALAEGALIDSNQIAHVRLQIGTQEFTKLQVKLLWGNDEGLVGYRIIKSDESWSKIIAHLQMDLSKSSHSSNLHSNQNLKSQWA